MNEVTVECPGCGLNVTVNCNGLYQCKCGQTFTVDAFAMVPSEHIDEDSCGLSTVEWAIKDMNLRHIDRGELSKMLNLRKDGLSNLFPGLNLSGTLPFAMVNTLRNVGASVTNVYVRVIRFQGAPSWVEKLDDGERAIVLFKPECGWHWVGIRRSGKKILVADNLGRFTWRDIKVGNGCPQLFMRIERSSERCPLVCIKNPAPPKRKR